MSGTPRTTLKPGDLVMWVEETPNMEPSPLLVTEDGQSFQFQFGRKPWHEMTFLGDTRGLTVEQAQVVLERYDGDLDATGLPGRLYKCYDEATGQSFPDPHLEESV